MLKETIISIVIIIMIFTLDMFTQGYTRKTSQEITGKMTELKTNLLKLNNEKIDKTVQEIDEIWAKKHDRLAYYIEHDELEKVDTAIIEVKSYIETEDYSSAVAELDKGKFVLEHIEEKYSFNIQNVF